LSSDAVKHAVIAASSAGQSKTSQNITETVTSAVASAVMPNILTSDTPADTPQTITTPIGNSGWADEFSQKIIWMSTNQNQTAELHLNPPDLGPLNVVLKISDNQLTAQFTSPHSAVRDAVENALPKLREILADNNIMLGNATVSDQSPRDRSGEGFMNQGSGTAAQREISYNETELDKLLTTTAQSVPARRHNGMLDTFA
jgi:flagellar hook-length control protein FliK